MSVLRRIRDTVTGRYTTAADAAARPGSTVSETELVGHTVTPIGPFPAGTPVGEIMDAVRVAATEHDCD